MSDSVSSNVEQSSPSPASGWKLYVLTFFMFLNAFITPSGVIYGWIGLEDMLKKEGQFSSGCPAQNAGNSTHTNTTAAIWSTAAAQLHHPLASNHHLLTDDVKCTSQDNALANIYAVAANIATVATVIFGVTLDFYGVRSNAFVGAVLNMAGWILLAYSDSESFNAFIPAYSLIAFGGIGTYLAAFQFSSLYSRPTFILSAQSALFGAAGLLFVLFQFLYDRYGITRKTSFLFYGCLVAFCAVDILLLYPSKAYKPGDKIRFPILQLFGCEKPEAEFEALDDEEDQNSKKAHPNIAVNGDSGPVRKNSGYSPLLQDAPAGQDISLAVAGQDDDTQSVSSVEVARLQAEALHRDLTAEEKDLVKSSYTLKWQLFNSNTIWLSLHFSIGLLCSNFYNANIGDELKAMGDSDGVVSKIFLFIASLFPIVFSPFIDVLQKKIRYAGLSFISTLLLIVGYGALFIDNKWAQVPFFFVFTIGRAVLITLMFAYVNTEYRREHYGRIVGFVTLVCAVVGFLQLLMQNLVNNKFNNDFRPLNGFVMVILTPLFYFSHHLNKQRI